MANELMIGSLYKALRSANVPDEEAIKAASDVSSFENCLNTIERQVVVLDTKLDQLRWMVVLVIGGVTAVLIRSFWPVA